MLELSLVRNICLAMIKMPIMYNVQNDNFNKDLRRVSIILSGIYHPDENYQTIGMLIVDKDAASYVRLWNNTCQRYLPVYISFISRAHLQQVN